jgi:phytoene dehydrogenase-like protein
MMIEEKPLIAKRIRAPERNIEFSREHYDAIVIGAGIGGLTTAAVLAKRGLSVLVLEMHYELGGCATVFSRKGKGQGYQFDVGLHYIGDCGMGGLIPRILEGAGVEPLDFREQDPNGFDTLYFPDFQFKIPRGIELFRERLKSTFPAEVKGIDRYIKLLYQVWTISACTAGVRHGARQPQLHRGSFPGYVHQG